MVGGLRSVGALAGDDPGRSESRHLQAQTDQELAMVVEVRGVREAVPANVRPGGILRVGPPVVTLGKVVVSTAFASRGVDAGDRFRLLLQVSIGGAQDACAVDLRDVELCRGSLRLSDRSEAPHGCCGGSKKLSAVHPSKSIAGAGASREEPCED